MSDSGDSSSSEDEAIKEALREATDSRFLKKSFFNDKEEERGDNDSSDAKGHAQKFDEFGVSEGFKDFVAKKLFDFLDRNVEVEETRKKHKKPKKRKTEDCAPPSGIKLLSSSTTLLTTAEEDVSSQHTSKPAKKMRDTSSKDDIERCREAAVDPDWIISKRETEHWTERRRGTVFEYKKLPNGTLVEKS